MEKMPNWFERWRARRKARRAASAAMQATITQRVVKSYRSPDHFNRGYVAMTEAGWKIERQIQTHHRGGWKDRRRWTTYSVV